MAETEIAGVKYRVGRLDARKQFHVARRLTPVMGALVAALKGGEGELSGENVLSALVPMSEAVATMADADADYVITTCLGACERESVVHGAGWSPVSAPNGRLMFDDIALPQMLQLVAAVIQENLAPFFPGLGRTSA